MRRMCIAPCAEAFRLSIILPRIIKNKHLSLRPLEPRKTPLGFALVLQQLYSLDVWDCTEDSLLRTVLMSTEYRPTYRQQARYLFRFEFLASLPYGGEGASINGGDGDRALVSCLE